MPGFRWKRFLREFAEALLDDDEVREALPDQAVESGWLGAPGATAEELEAFQARLGVTLPPSYLDFLATSNGWLTTGWQSIRLWSADEVGWLRDLDPELVEIWTNVEGPSISDKAYFVYGDDQDTIDVRREYFPEMLAISSRDWANQDQFWLNPKIRTEDGEWEAWHFSSEYPGASRYRSFRDLMVEGFRSIRDDSE